MVISQLIHYYSTGRVFDYETTEFHNWKWIYSTTNGNIYHLIGHDCSHLFSFQNYNIYGKIRAFKVPLNIEERLSVCPSVYLSVVHYFDWDASINILWELSIQPLIFSSNHFYRSVENVSCSPKFLFFCIFLVFFSASLTANRRGSLKFFHPIPKSRIKLPHI